MAMEVVHRERTSMMSTHTTGSLALLCSTTVQHSPGWQMLLPIFPSRSFESSSLRFLARGFLFSLTASLHFG